MNNLPPKNCTDCPVFKKSLFKDFNHELLSWLSSRKKPVSFHKKTFLFHQGNKVEGLFCHLQGLGRVVQTDAKGNIRFSRFVLPGDTSGHRSLFIEETYKGSTDVISDDLQACFIPKSEILYLFSGNSSFAKNLVIRISEELNRSEEESIALKERNVRSRLAQLLYKLCLNYANQINDSQFLIRSEITKKDIANVLMVASETIIRLMSEMKAEGLIATRSSRRIHS